LQLRQSFRFSSKEDFIAALCKTNYDMFIVDSFCADEKLDFSDVQRLQVKPNGERRQVIAYMSIGEAETYRYYWNESWKRSKPAWLKKENPLWKGNYKVAYWHPEWQKIIFGTEDSYLQKILDAGFDGAREQIIQPRDRLHDPGSVLLVGQAHGAGRDEGRGEAGAVPVPHPVGVRHGQSRAVGVHARGEHPVRAPVVGREPDRKRRDAAPARVDPARVGAAVLDPGDDDGR